MLIMEPDTPSRSGSDGGGGGGMRMRPPPPPRDRTRPRSRELPPTVNKSDLMKTLMEIQQQKDSHPKNLRDAFPDMEHRLLEVNRTKNLWFQPSMTKTQAADMLSSSKPRSFVVRESQKEPGAYAVTARAPEDLIRRSQNPPIPPGTYIPGRMCIRHFRIFPRSHSGGYSIAGWGNCYFETISEWIVAFTVIGPDPNFALELPRLHEPIRDNTSSGYATICDNFVKDGKPVDPKEWYMSLLTRALKEGSVKVRTSVMTMQGAPGTGKSSFQDLVLGRPPLPVRHSTPLTMCPVRTMAGERAFVDSKSGDSSCKWMSIRPGDLMDLIAKAVRKIDEIPPLPSLLHPPSLSSSAPVAPPIPQPQKKQRFEMLKRVRKAAAAPVVQDPVTPAASEPVPPSAASPSEVLEPQLDHSGAAQNLLELLSTAAKSDQLFNVHWIYIIDSGGQPQFQDILPLFVRNNMINVITFRLTQKLDDKPIFEFVHEGKHICQPIDLQLTNLELIESLVRSLCTFHQASGNDSLPVGARFVLVGTFADQVDECKEETVADKNKKLIESLEAYEKVRVDYNTAKGEVIVAVNAVVEKDREKEAERMREILTRALEATGIQEIEIPLRWFVLELDISRIATKKNQFVLLLSECVEAGRKLGMSEAEVIEALKYFDRSALYLYFPESLPWLVFVNPQPLLNKLTEIIVVSFADSLDLIPILHYISAGDYQRLKRDGIFSLSLLKCLSTGFIKGVFEEKDFLTLLEFLLIVAPIRQEGKEVEYFLPCVLPRQNLTSDQKHNFVSKSDSWVLTWSSEPTPLGLFPATVVHLLTRKNSPFFKPPHKTKEFPCQLRNAVRLACISLGGAVLIVDNHCWMEIYYSGEPSLCPTVRGAVIDAILSAGTKLHYSDLLDSKQEGFMCSLCTGNPAHPCTVITLPNGKVQATCSQDQSLSGVLTDKRKLVWLAIDSEPDIQPPPSSTSSSFARCDLLNDLAAKVPDKWKKIGTQLNLTLNQLDAIARCEHDPIDQCMKMLDWWQRLESTRRPCSWSTIVAVLRTNAVAEESLADELNIKYCHPHS